MANGAWGGGKGDQDRTRNKEAFNDNFNKIFPNAFVPSWKRRAQEEAAAEAAKADEATPTQADNA